MNNVINLFVLTTQLLCIASNFAYALNTCLLSTVAVKIFASYMDLSFPNFCPISFSTSV